MLAAHYSMRSTSKYFWPLKTLNFSCFWIDTSYWPKALYLPFWAARRILSTTKKIRKKIPETMIIEAPDVRLYW